MEELNEAELQRNLKAKEQELLAVNRELETAKQKLSAQEKQLKSEIDRLNDQIKIKDKLISDYSSQINNAQGEITQEAFNEKKKEVEELTEKIASLEEEKFLQKQDQTGLERKIQTLTEENSQLKLEVNKLKEEKKNASNAALTADFNLEDLPKDLDENVRKKFEALLQSKLEFEETSKQFGDLFEETENERKDLEDKLTLIELQKNEEISKLKAEIQELKADLADGPSALDLHKDLNKPKEGGDDDSVNTEKFRTLQECYLDLENEYESYKKNSEFEIQNLNSRVLTSEQRAQGFEEKLQEIIEDNTQKTNKIDELTQQIIDFQNNQENDKSQNFQLIESYMNEIKNLRDQKSEYEQKEKNKFNKMQTELIKQIEDEKKEKEKAYSDLEEFKRKNKNMDSEIKIKMKAFTDAHQKEIQDREIKIADLSRKLGEGQVKIKGLMENTKTLHLTKEKEIDAAKKAFQAKLDSTVAEKEKIVENSKKLLQQIKELKEALEKKNEEIKTNEKSESLANILEDPNSKKQNEDNSAKVQELNDEITLLNHENDTLKDKNNELIKRNTVLEKQNTDLQTTLKENEELKNNIKNAKEMYEKQYNDLKLEMEQKLKELATSRRKNSTLRNSLSLTPNETELMNKLNEQIKKITSEKEYFEKLNKTSEEQIEKLKSVIEETKNHYEKQIEEIGKSAADSALMAATIAFDKDQEILTLKRQIKKLKAKK